MSTGPHNNTVRNAKIVEMVARGGKTLTAVGQEFGLSRVGIYEVLQKNRDKLEARKIEIQMRVAEKMQKRLEKVTDGLLDSAENPENRNQPQAAKVVGEWGTVTGKQTHYGDKHTHINGDVKMNVDARQIVIETTPEEGEKKLAELRARLG